MESRRFYRATFIFTTSLEPSDGQVRTLNHQDMSDQRYLTFLLDVDDGWPPVGAENIPVRPVNDEFEVLHPPLFVKGLSVGDVIQVSGNEAGEVSSWNHRSRSGHSTIWILRLKATQEIENLLANLRAMGCLTVGGNMKIGAYSIDVPPTLQLEKVDVVLSGLDTESIAVAYPSLRHPEPN